MTGRSFLGVARAITPLFAAAGFVTTDEFVDSVSDNGLVEMKSDNVVLRVVRDRNQWFVEMRSTTADEWFDARFVLAELGDTQSWQPPKDEAALRSFVQRLVVLAPQWNLLFIPAVYEESKRELNARELISARERFGYTPKG